MTIKLPVKEIILNNEQILANNKTKEDPTVQKNTRFLIFAPANTKG